MWTKKLMTMSLMHKEEDRGSEEIIEMYCEVCKKKGKECSAEGYCVDCVRYFCEICLAYHTEFLPDHVHKDKKNMPQDVCLNPCPSHADEIIKFYCSSCNTFFCSLCRKAHHKDCSNVNHLPQLVEQLEKGQEFSDLRRDLKAIVEETRSMDSALARDKDSVETISETAVSKIDLSREHIIKWVDASVEKMKTSVKEIKDKDLKVIQDDSSKVSAIMLQLSSVMSDIEQKLQNVKRCELFMAMKDAQTVRKKFQDDLKEMKERDISRYEFETVKDTELMLVTPLKLGKIVFKTSEDNIISKSKDQELKSKPKPVQQVTYVGKKRRSIPNRFQRESKLVTEVVDVETQKDFIANTLQRPLIKGEIWYLLDVKWFKQWKSYVGYESWDHYNVGEEPAHPGPIDNTPIFQEGSTKLKEHLVDDLDYQLVPEEGWIKLLSWYGILDGQEPIARRVIEEGVYGKSLKIEVYLWNLKICVLPNQDEHVSKQFSRINTVGHLEEIMRKEFNIPAEKEVRLWNRYLPNMYEQLTIKDYTLQEAGLYHGQVIVIEQRNCDGTWPRDK